MVELADNHRSYNLLKEFVIRESSSFSHIDNLKSMFADAINSTRRLECIRSVADLIDCLEHRDIISEQNVEPLRYFIDQRQHEIIRNYTPPPNNQQQPVNEYHKMQVTEDDRTKLSISRLFSMQVNGHVGRINLSDGGTATVSKVLSESKRAAIYKVLSQNLGTHWRAFGRELNLREGAMDEIEVQFPRDLPSRIYKVLQQFEENDAIDPKQHLRLIRDALDQCRRKDVRRQVDNIISH